MPMYCDPSPGKRKARGRGGEGASPVKKIPSAPLRGSRPEAMIRSTLTSFSSVERRSVATMAKRMGFRADGSD
jgi:hypothetical protein